MKKLYVRQVTVSVTVVSCCDSPEEADELARKHWREEAEHSAPMIAPLSVVPREWQTAIPYRKGPIDFAEPSIVRLIEGGMEVAEP